MTGTFDVHDLRYLDAESVRCATGSLSGFRVCTDDAKPLGSVDGVLISPALRQLRYFVIETPGLLTSRRYLLPADAVAIVQQDRKTLQLETRRDELTLESFNPRSVPEFNDADLLDALFSAAS